MRSFHIKSYSSKDTQRIGSCLGELAMPGDIILLTGELGAGKTCLTQGIAWGLGVNGYVSSPSFMLVREYQGRLALYHIDLYRLESTEEIDDLGLEGYIYGEGVCVVEWADRGLVNVVSERMLIEIGHISEDERSLDCTARGVHYEKTLGHLKSLVHQR